MRPIEHTINYNTTNRSFLYIAARFHTKGCDDPKGVGGFSKAFFDNGGTVCGECPTIPSVY